MAESIAVRMSDDARQANELAQTLASMEAERKANQDRGARAAVDTAKATDRLVAVSQAQQQQLGQLSADIQQLVDHAEREAADRVAATAIADRRFERALFWAIVGAIAAIVAAVAAVIAIFF